LWRRHITDIDVPSSSGCDSLVEKFRDTLVAVDENLGLLKRFRDWLWSLKYFREFFELQE